MNNIVQEVVEALEQEANERCKEFVEKSASEVFGENITISGLEEFNAVVDRLHDNGYMVRPYVDGTKLNNIGYGNVFFKLEKIK